MIKKELIVLDKELKSRKEVFDWVAETVSTQSLISDKNLFKEALYAREQEFATSIGYGIAIPHCRSAAVLQPCVSFVRLTDFIEWDPKSEETVKMIFVIAIPEENENNLHLKVLSSISRKLMHEDFRGSLMNSTSVDDVYMLLDEINKI